MLVNFKATKCKWCSTQDTFKCQSCGYYTCLECKRFPTENSCVHKAYEPIESDDWIVDDKLVSTLI